MGQYFIFVNPIKRQFLDAHKFNEGVKSYSVLYGCHAYALALLVCNLAEVDHSYGQLAGSWCGDPVIVAGDDEGEPDAYGIKTSTLENPGRNLYWKASEEFEDISYRAVAMLSVGRKGFADEIVTRAVNRFNPNGDLIELGNVVIETGCDPLKQALVKDLAKIGLINIWPLSRNVRMISLEIISVKPRRTSACSGLAITVPLFVVAWASR